jgi:hypothetical protein
VHGLNGHCEKTWTADNGVNWLRDLLPHDLPNARIFSWGYDANTHSSSRVSCQYLFDQATKKMLYAVPGTKDRADKHAADHLRGAQPRRDHC